MYKSICAHAHSLSSKSLAVVESPAQWSRTLARRREQWLEMLGLFPLPERTPLKVKITGTLRRDGYIVDKLHFQSLPGAYVTGNLYRPEKVAGCLPAVIYLCGHSTEAKAHTPYQAQARWFGRHGYVALALDPIQVGEGQGLHHGTYLQGRWDWQSRGYTPAGVEVWNAMRAMDYLASRPDVDPARVGVTGLSGGGAIAWFLGAADNRVRCVAPVCQTGSIEQMAWDRSIDNHCDCAFWVNYYQWCTPDIGALIAPRPLLIAAGTEDVTWRPYAFRDVFHRIRRQYTALGAADNVRLVEDVAPHGYTPQISRAVFEWFNLHLRNDARPVTDESDGYVEPEKNLLVFDGKPPRRDRMRTVDMLLGKARPAPPAFQRRRPWTAYQQKTLEELRQLTFRHIALPPRPALLEWRTDGRRGGDMLSSGLIQTPDGLELRVRVVRPADAPRVPLTVLACAESAQQHPCGRMAPPVSGVGGEACVEVRNTVSTSAGPGLLWAVRRLYPLLGQTLAERQVCDLLLGVALLRQQVFAGPVTLYGKGATAVLALYAALLDPDVAGVVLEDLPASHMEPGTPSFLGVLRIGDLPVNLALLFPRRITLRGKTPAAYRWTEDLYRQFGQGRRFTRG